MLIIMATIQITPTQRAVRLAGGPSALAKAINELEAEGRGITPQSVSDWVKHDRIPAERVLVVERITGVSRYELRPDVYGEPPEQPATATAVG